MAATGDAVGIIGGSGVYDLDGFEDAEWQTVETPFGAPSDAMLQGTLDGQRLVFLPRHGRGHRVPPSELNFRANIDALKRAGCSQVISVSAVGSLKEELSPGTFVLVDQFIDRTFARVKSFFSSGMVGHVSMAHPVCGRLGEHLMRGAAEAGVSMVRGGTYLVMEGPQFSTLAESELYRSWGCDVIGMTNMPEAKLSREAEMCYATVAMVTDYDCWHPHHDDVTVDAIIAVLLANADNARSLVKATVPHVHGDSARPCARGCQTALDTALITAPEARDPEILAKLDAVAGRVL
ncbi:MAG: S-methyl-5'-thioadenosine phosphorylase [Alphaproteobacteria bacterium]|jgi:5'-methylthioadenosine phosphorylase|nr:S-methyl-5'-thioadenosine phosphorylase [Alphaproteobacteria bacterium]MDP6237471.1 S-methyl-5'-thioadenosine phosphorylase [Alphaproteobacteria bacterium]MDP7172936.1 S-methyl-5'-thioadenosine phosphorylase [Alphaproteobacteria bacterium]MDP7233686.1 S-methyl-5'-thioadenosine phosphorylase [Alphaproteobacteria bacterium]MDP7486751.1 S-methyl-5'-thioadenosine phosphorylase [Alphaproteobacteria bacterium]|tara:strand:+ start:263 stop:1141 length:879 start_codon:yes stop_codon:yes gene_type:complete